MPTKSDKRRKKGRYTVALVATAALLLAITGFAVIKFAPFGNAPEEPAKGEKSGIGTPEHSSGGVEYRTSADLSVTSLLTTGKMSNVYLHEYTVSSGTDGPETFYSVLRDNDEFDVRIFRGGSKIAEVSYLGGMYRNDDYLTGSSIELKGMPDDMSFERITGTVSLLDLVNFSLSYREGTNASWYFGTAVGCRSELLRDGEQNTAVITVECTDHIERYYIDFDGGVVVRAETETFGKTTSHVTTTLCKYNAEEDA